MEYNFKINQTTYIPGQITILPEPAPFGVTSAKVAIVCPDIMLTHAQE